jgi:ATP synthase protein I
MAASDGKSDGAGGASDADLARRLERLSRDLESEKRERVADERSPKSDSAGYALAFRMASEFVAGVLVGVALGWGLDYVAGTSPWGLIGLTLLGFATGIFNVVRLAGRTTGPHGDDGEVDGWR